jgi:type IV secretory pathway TraG/TraD family ATPase VirD4
VILDADKLETCRPWLRLVIACALDARTLARRWGPARLFMLSECAQLGHLEPIAAAHGQGHGYDVQLFRILQDVSRLRAIAKRDANAVSDSMAARYRRERR